MSTKAERREKKRITRECKKFAKRYGYRLVKAADVPVVFYQGVPIYLNGGLLVKGQTPF